MMHKLRNQFLPLRNVIMVSWLIKKLLSGILRRYIFICSDGHYVNIYGYYETDDSDANRDQARFSR